MISMKSVYWPQAPFHRRSETNKHTVQSHRISETEKKFINPKKTWKINKCLCKETKTAQLTALHTVEKEAVKIPSRVEQERKNIFNNFFCSLSFVLELLNDWGWSFNGM